MIAIGTNLPLLNHKYLIRRILRIARDLGQNGLKTGIKPSRLKVANPSNERANDPSGA